MKDIYKQVDSNQYKNTMFSYVHTIFFDNEIKLPIFPTIFIVIYMFISFPFVILRYLFMSWRLFK